MKASRGDIIRYIIRAVRPLYSAEEARRIAYITASALSGDPETRFMVERDEIADIPSLEEKTAELAAGRPVQYVTGVAEFCGITLAVGEGVLIPRPETEELAMWTAECAARFLRPRILDACTGSGCIAAALALRIPEAEVTALDISPAALAAARRNCRAAGAEVRVVSGDALAGMPTLAGEEFDIIVSNPPYIPRSERERMHVNVREYEPAEALFVDDGDPLAFYRSIVRAARRMLADGGFLLFEVHETLAERTAELLRDEGFPLTELRNDIFGKPRMTCSRNRR